MKFTDLLDNYLLTLGIHNLAHANYEAEPLRFAQDYRESVEALKVAKEQLNSYMDSLQESLSGLTTP